MDGGARCPLVILGHERVLPGGSDLHLLSHEGEGHLRHGQGGLCCQGPCIHGRHPLGASGDPAKGYVPTNLYNKSY